MNSLIKLNVGANPKCEKMVSIFYITILGQTKHHFHWLEKLRLYLWALRRVRQLSVVTRLNTFLILNLKVFC